jgi:hypothetical protein
MATLKKTTGGAPAKPSASRALQPWEEQMKAAAVKQAAIEKPMGLFKQVSIKSGVMIIDDKPVPGNKLRAVVLAATHENQWFNKPYDPGVPAVPACYAFGDVTLDDPEGAMAPKDDVDDKQGDDNGLCNNCWANKMGSADTGKGKACANVRRLILTTEDALESAEALKNAEARSLKVPVMSVRNWIAFVHEIQETMQRPYYGVIVEVSVVPDVKSQWQVKFAFQELVQFDQALYDAMQRRVKQANVDILAPYPKLEEQEAAAPKGKPGAMPQNGRKGSLGAPKAQPGAVKGKSKF